MERCLRSVQTLLFAALNMIGVYCVSSTGFPVDGSAARPRRITPGGEDPISMFQGLLGQLAHERVLSHFADAETVDGFEKNLYYQFGTDVPRRTARIQLVEASPNAEVDVLMAFKVGITSDPLQVLSSWNSNDSNPCHWRGVTCNQHQNSVVTLELDDLQLTGTISPLLGSLQNLQQLNLSSNSFTGGIPTSLLNCSQLSNLVLRDNELTGSVPSELGKLRNLQVLDLSTNVFLGGDVPASLGNCSNLRLLDFHFTTVGGEIPESLGQLSHLQILNLSYTLNTGTVPKSLGNCSALTNLNIGNLYDETNSQINPNNAINSGIPPSPYLSGELPAELGQLTSLKALGVFGANIGGVFPTWIANLTSLNELAIVSCLLTGEIPDFLGFLPLEMLALSETLLTSSIPDAITNCTNLWLLVIIDNAHVTGPMPRGLGMLPKLGTLALDYNYLTGQIPSSISNCSRLRTLGLGPNPLLDPQPVPSWVASFVNLTFLVLEEMNLVGEIPTFLGQVSKLDHLALDSNKLSGAIPKSLGNCTGLVYLSLGGNLLTGEFPSEIFAFHHLTRVNISQNYLTGILPQTIGNFSQVVFFDVSGNLLSGEVPSQVGRLQNLGVADFSGNNFSGPVPLSIRNCSGLNSLNFSQNKMSGSLPSSLPGNLATFDISKNQMEGQIPPDLLRYRTLVYLDLSHNFLVGSIPQEIGLLVSLQTLFLQHNQLSGALPQSLGFPRSLLQVDLSGNSLSGGLPLELGNLSSLLYLNCSFNNLSGFIPWSLGDCGSLESLDLSMNNLSGRIPQIFGQLLFLSFVNMSYNDLEGALPSGGLFSSSNLSAASFLGNPGLCGNPFLKSCVRDLSRPHASCGSFRCDGAKVAAASVGALIGVIILGAIASRFLSKGLVCGGWHGDGEPYLQMFQFTAGLALSCDELLGIIDLPENIIGKGARSTVYKAALKGGVVAAVKVLDISDAQEDTLKRAHAELHREAHNLSSIRHRSVVRVLGFMTNQRVAALLLEYVPNGSLYNHLYSHQECGLDWRTRLNIAVGIAEGIFYLHHQTTTPIIHRDLKPGNILLDADLVPKLSDFGISKMVTPKNEDRGETTMSMICGTTGYIPPEYGASSVVSTKGDVYSYGVIMLELLTRKHPVLGDNKGTSEAELKTGGHIVDLVLATQETPFAVVDPMLLIWKDDTVACRSREVGDKEQMAMFVKVALLCTQESPERRPAVSDVLAMLRQIQNRGSNPPERRTLEALANEP